ncbi:MAG: threonine/serine exporter family protein [Phycisphaerales bacterium]
MPAEDSDAIQRFLTEMPRALATYGTPAHRLEEAMVMCAEKLGQTAEFFSMPTAVICAIGEGDQTRTHMVRVIPGEVDLEKLDRVDAILGQVLRGELSPREALGAIEHVRRMPTRYPLPITVASFAVAGGCAVRFFAGSWTDALAATALGLIVGLLGLAAGRFRQTARVTDFVSGLIAALIATLLAGRVQALTPGVVVISSLIVLVPGLTLTTAINELATRNLVAGTARSMHAVMILLSIGFGVGTGQAIAASWALEPVPGSPMPAWTEPIAIVLVPLALTVLFRARPRDVLVIVPAAVVGYYGARFGTALVGPELGSCLGAFAVGLFGNGYARLSRRPTAITLVPGIMLLVPGAVGYTSVTSFMAGDVLTGVEAAFRMVIVATGIVIGLLLANVLLPSRQSL